MRSAEERGKVDFPLSSAFLSFFSPLILPLRREGSAISQKDFCKKECLDSFPATEEKCGNAFLQQFKYSNIQIFRYLNF